jgi:hypothetical protein
MIKSEIDATVAAIRALRKAGAENAENAEISTSEREKAFMTHRMDKAREIENRRIDQDD